MLGEILKYRVASITCLAVKGSKQNFNTPKHMAMHQALHWFSKKHKQILEPVK